MRSFADNDYRRSNLYKAALTSSNKIILENMTLTNSLATAQTFELSKRLTETMEYKNQTKKTVHKLRSTSNISNRQIYRVEPHWIGDPYFIAFHAFKLLSNLVNFKWNKCIHYQLLHCCFLRGLDEGSMICFKRLFSTITLPEVKKPTKSRRK